MKDVTEIVGELVDSLNFEYKTKSVEVITYNDKDAYKLNACKTYWITDCTKITINISGTDYIYKVVDLKANEYITLQPLLESSPALTINETFSIPKPTYRHGTARAINEELTKINESDKRLFFWLYETIKEKHISEPSSLVDRESNVRMFVFAESDTENWWTEEHYSKVIRPLKSIFVEIRNKIDKNRTQFGKLEDFEETNLPDWGEFNEVRGMESKIMDENWSGIEGKTLLNIRNICKPCC